MKNSLDEIYDRIIDLAVKVAEGDVDPFDIDVGRFISILSKNQSLDKLEYGFLLKDIRALNGLIAILEAQGKFLKKRGMGLYLDKMLLQLKIFKMDINELAGVFAMSWKPIATLEMINLDGVREAISYFNNLSDLASRRFSLEEKQFSHIDFKPKLFIVPSELKSLMNKLYYELKNYSKEEYVDYDEFIMHKGDPIENAYLLSFLISEGWVNVKVDRLEEKIWIKPMKHKKELVNSSSLAVVIRREK